jgi:hypothetical protein
MYGSAECIFRLITYYLVVSRGRGIFQAGIPTGSPRGAAILINAIFGGDWCHLISASCKPDPLLRGVTQGLITIQTSSTFELEAPLVDLARVALVPGGTHRLSGSKVVNFLAIYNSRYT